MRRTVSSAPAPYSESSIPGDPVIFDDSATGTKTVNVTTTVSPGLVIVNNTTPYAFIGTGKISGSAVPAANLRSGERTSSPERSIAFSRPRKAGCSAGSSPKARPSSRAPIGPGVARRNSTTSAKEGSFGRPTSELSWELRRLRNFRARR